MTKRIRASVTYANVVATLALFIALGGGAWALSKNSIGARELEKNAVRSAEVKNNSVKGKDVKNESLEGTDVKNGSLAGDEIAADSLNGAQINESALGQVPDAERLAGRSFSFSVTDSTATTRQTIAELPSLGAELMTDGDADTALSLSIRNERPPGAAGVTLHCRNTSVSVGPGDTGALAVGGDVAAVCSAHDSANPAAPGRALVFCFGGVTARLMCDVLRQP